jgi:hypothetical protein
MASYAINKAYLTCLQPELLRQYEYISVLWHKWLCLDELEQKCEERCSAYQWQSKQPQQQKRQFDGQCLQAAASNKRQATNKAVEVPIVSKAAQLPTPSLISPMARAELSPNQLQQEVSVCLERSLDHSINGSNPAAEIFYTEPLAPLLCAQDRVNELKLKVILKENLWL